MACFALVTSATEADVLRQPWTRKVQELKVVLPDEGGTVALFRSPWTIFNLRRKVSEWKQRCAIDHAQVRELAEDEWLARRSEAESAPPPEARAPTELVRRSPLQAALELLPAMTRAERHCLLVKLLAIDLPPVSPETRLLDTKERMQKILRERPLAAWGEALAPFVAAALADAGERHVNFVSSRDACYSGLALLLTHPPAEWGFKRTRRPELDPPMRVVDVRKVSFHDLGFDEPKRFPADPPPGAERAFAVKLQLQDSNGDWSPVVTVPWHNFSENKVWKQSVDLDFKLWASSRQRWCYNASSSSIYSYLEFERRAHPQAPPDDVSPSLKRYLGSAEYAQILADQQETAEYVAERRKRFRIDVDDVDPLVWQMLELRKRRRLEAPPRAE